MDLYLQCANYANKATLLELGWKHLDYIRAQTAFGGEHAFHQSDLWILCSGRGSPCSAKMLHWWQRWDNDNCQTGVALPMCFPGQDSGRVFSEGKVM